MLFMQIIFGWDFYLSSYYFWGFDLAENFFSLPILTNFLVLDLIQRCQNLLNKLAHGAKYYECLPESFHIVNTSFDYFSIVSFLTCLTCRGSFLFF